MEVSFLDLPYNIRRHIYILAGLVRFCPIDLNFEGTDRKSYIAERRLLRESIQADGTLEVLPEEAGRDAPFSNLLPKGCVHLFRKYLLSDDYIGFQDCICQPLPYGLLFVSRRIHDEVSRVLYSENSFSISRSNRLSLQPLESLSSRALAALKTLTIRLNCTTCIETHHCVDPPGRCACHPSCNRQGRHDGLIDHTDNRGRAVIKDWKRTLEKLAPHVQSDRLTLAVVCDVKSLSVGKEVVQPLFMLPALKHCSIRLNPKPGCRLRSLAESAALRMTKPPQCEASSVHHCCDLPGEIITMILEYTNLVVPFDLEWCPERGLPPFTCCRRCNDSLEACSCSGHQAAYSTTCVCWRLPRPLFLVSHQLYKLASHVFFSRNRFVISPFRREMPFASQTPLMLDMTKFLLLVPSNAWESLRFLRWNIPPLGPNLFLSGDLGTQNWLSTVQLISEKANLAQLDLVLCLQGHGSLLRSNDQSIGVQMSVQRLVRPLQKLEGLKGFYVATRCSHFIDPCSQQDLDLQKLVMGKSYEGRERGASLKQVLWSADDFQEEAFGPTGLRIWPVEGAEVD